MKKITLFLPFAMCLWAAEFWQTKAFTDWSEKDVQRIETNSPWAKQVSIATGEGGGGGGTGKSGRKGGGGGGEDRGIGGGGSSGGRGIQEASGGSMGGGASFTVLVCWQTALPIRQAVAKVRYKEDVATSPDAKNLLEKEQKYYAILVSGLPGRSMGNVEKMKDALLKNTTLSVKGKDAIQASDVQSGGNEQKTVLLFLFPKTAPFDLDDKDVEFFSRLGPLVVRQKFHLKDMVFNGKLEL